MSYNKPICDPVTDWMIEEGWQISRRFMQEIETEFELEGRVPIELLLASTNLQKKWLEFAQRN